jgi:uncharacterized protein YciI
MKKIFLLSLLILYSINMSAQPKDQFVYEITLFEQFKHRSRWTEKEEQIQKEHLAYLDSLTKAGIIEMAGIQSQGLAEHKGFILLNVQNYEEAKSIALNDPSVKEGMMTVRIYPFTTYFKNK